MTKEGRALRLYKGKSMRIKRETNSTGLAYFPGLAEPVTIDTRQLPEEVAQELGRLVAKAGVFDEPEREERKPELEGYDPTLDMSDAEGGRYRDAAEDSRIEVPPKRGAADYRQYTYVIQEGKKRVTMRVSEPVEDPNLRSLVSYINNLAEGEKKQKAKPRRTGQDKKNKKDAP